MKKILIVTGRYIPGYKDGGPVRTIKNLVDALGKEYEFSILTLDRDRGDSEAYTDVKINEWNKLGNERVYYAPRERFDFGLVKRLAREADLVYVCGCFDFYARIIMNLKRKKEISSEVIIAAMGLFSPGAYHIKRWKKDAYIMLMKGMGNFQSIAWSATSEEEVQDIKRVIGENAICHIAQDLPRPVAFKDIKKHKEKGSVRIIFLSRISLKKNLLYAVDVVGNLKGKVVFDIYGPVEDENYWDQCKRKMSLLPDHIVCNYKGMVDSEKVIDVFREYHVFLFPTLGENFGHVIFEALAGGCIPVISDQTPWKDFDEQGVGYVRSLDHKAEFQEVLQKLMDSDFGDIEEKIQNIKHYVNDISNRSFINNGYRKMFK